jgi:NAD(P)-dependent dehydrogenase (short-subunit alcohol dehydrogenase family)
MLSGKGALAGRSVVVVGGSSGMGLATARMARDAGASVSIAGRDAERLEAASSDLGPDIRCIQVDVSNETQVRDLFASLDQVDHVVTLAGASVYGRVAETETEVLRVPMEVRFWGSLYICKYAPGKMNGQGSITLSSGVVVERSGPGRGVGAASTAATEAFARAMARELAPIRVNTIRPGGVDTPMTERLFGDGREKFVAEQAARLPVGRFGEPDDIARAILFLMEDGYVTGITLTVDGGHLLL